MDKESLSQHVLSAPSSPDAAQEIHYTTSAYEEEIVLDGDVQE
jgi:hypothetical protein